MNSRQALISTKGGGVEFIYKPGFVDDANLESVKMAVDKELSLISNSFYRLAETMQANQSKLKGLYDEAVLRVATLEQQVEALDARVAKLGG
ncbi:MAG: hypothetical protein ACRC6V_15135 [Bacteroidales bacterium]